MKPEFDEILIGLYYFAGSTCFFIATLLSLIKMLQR